MNRRQRCATVFRRAGTANPPLSTTLALAVLVLWFGLLVGSAACATKDTIPPTTPTNLRYDIVNSNTTLFFSWEAATDEGSGVAFYLVKTSWEGSLSDHWNYNGPNTDWYASAPSTPGPHVFQVKAVDKAENESAPASIQFSWNATSSGQ